MQEVPKLGLRPPDWPEFVEGTYLRIDIPLIVPFLLDWLEGQQTGELPSHYPSQEQVGDNTEQHLHACQYCL